MSENKYQEAEDCVSSEVHSFSKVESLDKLTGAVLTRFDFTYPAYLTNNSSVDLKPLIDKDGDIAVVRHHDIDKTEGAILIEHQSNTTLDLVGEQVWRGALFLSDYIFYDKDTFRNACVLEVAAGVGLTSIAAAISAKKVILSDVDRGAILNLARKNIKRNQEMMKADVEVAEIDFCHHETIENISTTLKDVSVIIAADVVYNNQLTDQFFSAVLCLMCKPPSKTMFIALEKRYVFTIEDLDTVAPCYEYFLTGLEWLRYQKIEEIKWTIDEVSSDFPQYFSYERCKHLVLWKIKAELK